MNSIDQRLEELGLEVPPPPAPVGTYAPGVAAGNRSCPDAVRAVVTGPLSWVINELLGILGRSVYLPLPISGGVPMAKILVHAATLFLAGDAMQLLRDPVLETRQGHLLLAALLEGGHAE